MSSRSLLAVSFLVVGLVSSPRAQLRPIPLPGVRMAQLAARVEIVDGVATTKLEQTWRNDGAAEAEATWLLPLPAGAVADGFQMVVNGVEVPGEVLDADRARSVYEGIVRSRRDPGLLEYFGRGCLRARIFPIPAHGTLRADVTFRQILPELSGLRRWSLALGAAGAEGMAPEHVVLDLVLRSKKALKNAYAPSPAIQVVQKGDHEVRASFEGAPAALGGAELALYHGLSEAEFGLDLLTHRGAGAPQGTFLMLISPKREWQRAETLKKSIAFVLDTSGSMEGKKIEQARNALRSFLQSLTPEDRFDVIPFATEPEPFFHERVPATSDRVAEALARCEGITASGGTNISSALEVALRGAADDGRVPLVVFLTDGAPTVGVTDPAQILAAVRQGNERRTRLFVFGVGNDVNTHLLDSLAAENGGARDYVRDHEAIDEKTRALFGKLAHPVMTDLVLAIDGLDATQVVPVKLPDLFAGDRLEVLGRYAAEGGRAIRLTGVVSGVRREYVYEGTFARETGPENAFVAALWAERRIGVLLDAIRLNGPNPELTGEIERLGREYRIVTPYTSHLVLEEGWRLGQFGGGREGRHRGPGDSVPPGGGGGAGPAPGLANSSTGSSEWFLGQGSRNEPAPATLESLAVLLAKEGVLPSDAPEEELVVLARSVASEMQESEARWSALGQASTGQAAVDDSQYLARLMARGKSGPRSLLELFSRRVQDKTFVLRGGIWIDQACGEPLPPERRAVTAFSSEYFALLAEKPALAPYLALSTRLAVHLGGEVFEIVSPSTVEPAAGR